MQHLISRRAWIMLLAALGLAGLLLFTDVRGELLWQWGPNVLVWTTLGLAAFGLIARWAGIKLRGDGLCMILPLLFFAASFFLREDEFLRFWNGVFLLVSAALLVTRCRGEQWRVSAAGNTEYLRLCALAGVYAAFGAVPALREKRGGEPRPAAPPRVVTPSPRLGGGGIGTVTPIGSAPRFAAVDEPVAQKSPTDAPVSIPAPLGTSADAAAAGVLTRGRAGLPITVVKGILLSAVPLLVFGSLFASADPVFRHLWNWLFDWNWAALVCRALWGALLGWIGIGLLHAALQREPVPDQIDRDRLPDGSIAPRSLTGVFQQGGDIVIALSLVSVLFAAFVAVQFNFLFGGAGVVRSVPGLNYAAYGRGGFFELAWVAGLALPMMLLAHWLTRASSGAARLRMRWCTGILTALLFVIVASAFKRMALYEMAWGMTEKRLLVSVFIGAISLVFVWFLATVWRGQPRRFAIGLLCAAMLTIAGLDVVNTDAWVVQVDAHRSRGLMDFSAYYLESYSADAVPALIKAMPRVAASQRPQLADMIIHDEGRTGVSDWRTWNASRAAASHAVMTHQSLLIPLAQECENNGACAAWGNPPDDD